MGVSINFGACQPSRKDRFLKGNPPSCTDIDEIHRINVAIGGIQSAKRVMDQHADGSSLWVADQADGSTPSKLATKREGLVDLRCHIPRWDSC